MTDLFTHDFNDQVEGSTITTVSGGPDTFDSVNPGAGTLTYHNNVPPALPSVGTNGVGQAQTVAGATPNMRWVPGGTIPIGYFGFFFQAVGLPSGNTIIWRTSESDSSGGAAFRITSTGQVQMLDDAFSLVDTFTFLLPTKTWIRLVGKVDTVGGVFEAGIFHGANLLGKTPDELLKGVGSFGDSILDSRWGIQTSRENTTYYYDYCQVRSDYLPLLPGQLGGPMPAKKALIRVFPGETSVDTAIQVTKSRSITNKE